MLQLTYHTSFLVFVNHIPQIGKIRILESNSSYTESQHTIDLILMEYLPGCASCRARVGSDLPSSRLLSCGVSVKSSLLCFEPELLWDMTEAWLKAEKALGLSGRVL